MLPGEKLRAWREKKDLSQGAAATGLGVSQATWSVWESGKDQPSVDSAFALETYTKGAVKAKDWAKPLPSKVA